MLGINFTLLSTRTRRLLNYAVSPCAVFHGRRNWGVANDLRNRDGIQAPSDSPLDHGRAWPLIYHNGLAGPVEGPCFTPEVVHDGRAIDDSRIVDDQAIGSDSVMKMADIDEDEE